MSGIREGRRPDQKFVADVPGFGLNKDDGDPAFEERFGLVTAQSGERIPIFDRHPFRPLKQHIDYRGEARPALIVGRADDRPTVAEIVEGAAGRRAARTAAVLVENGRKADQNKGDTEDQAQKTRGGPVWDIHRKNIYHRMD